MSTRAIASSTLWQIASQATMAALSIVTVKFVALGLGKELAGAYHSSYGFLQMFGILADFGLYAVAVREVSRTEGEERKRVLGTLMVLRTGILLLSLGAALLLAWAIPAWRGSPLPLGITIAALVPFFTLLAGMLRTVFQVHYRMREVFFAEVLQRTVTAGLIAWLVLGGIRMTTDPRWLYVFLGVGGVGAFVLLLLSYVQARRLEPIAPHWDAALLRSTFLQAAPYGLAFLCLTLYRQTDVTLIALLRDDYELQNAYYGFALRAVEMGYLLPTFLLNSTLPLLSKRHAAGEETARFSGVILFSILLLSSTIALYAFFWARPLMALLTTPAYLSGPTVPAGADTALRLLSVPMFFNGIILFSFYSLLTAHRWKPLVLTLAAGAALSILLNLFLIPRLGFVGAAWTAILIHVVLSILLLPQAVRALPLLLTGRQWITLCSYILLLGLLLGFSAPLLSSAIATIVFGALSALGIAVLVWGLGIHRGMRHTDTFFGV